VCFKSVCMWDSVALNYSPFFWLLFLYHKRDLNRKMAWRKNGLLEHAAILSRIYVYDCNTVHPTEIGIRIFRYMAEITLLYAYFHELCLNISETFLVASVHSVLPVKGSYIPIGMWQPTRNWLFLTSAPINDYPNFRKHWALLSNT
jgi:hypothetical protein